ncbi:MAG TPA: NYN domain-containing protein [Candidatus Acidoferrales bacterium]|nr:NYN domain-containing protein [Candidatus Acidoferrales bacterium]
MSTNQRMDLEEATVKPRVAIVIDSPNHMRRAQAAHGPDVEPDWYGLLREAEAAGVVTAAVAVVNHGASSGLRNRFEDAGYTVRASNAPDCDELVIAQIVRTCHKADVVVIGGGDGKYTDIAILLRQIGKRVLVLAVKGPVHASLLSAADQFVDLRVIHKSLLNVMSDESVKRAAA